MSRLVVIGGGIAGLATAWAAADAARRAGQGLEVLVLERGHEVGGKARSIVHDGWLVEGGPSGFLGGRPELDALLNATGLIDDVVPARLQAKRRFLYRAGRMREIKASPIGFVRAGILSARGLARLAAEPFIPRGTASADDETVWEFAARRLGAEVADRLVSPMSLGIFAGDARRLSLESAFPRMAAVEREHRSLIIGMIARRGRVAAGPLSSLRNGMQSLPLALAERGGFTVHRKCRVSALEACSGGWSVIVAGSAEPIEAEAVVLATEPWATAALLGPLHDGAAHALASIPCPPVAVVAFGFGRDARPRVPDGFGVLIARGEGFRMLGNLWETSLYPGRGPDGGILIRAMLGGAVDPGIGDLSDDAVRAIAYDEVRRLYGLMQEPSFSMVVRVPRAIPQYERGHRVRVAAVDSALAGLPGLAVTGSGLRGVAFADAAADGVHTGTRMAAWIGANRLASVA